MGGHGYATRPDYFDLPTLSVATFAAEPAAAYRRR
jgi:hypothetical protein